MDYRTKDDQECVFQFHFPVAHAHMSIGCICMIVACSRSFSWQDIVHFSFQEFLFGQGESMVHVLVGYEFHGELPLYHTDSTRDSGVVPRAKSSNLSVVIY